MKRCLSIFDISGIQEYLFRSNKLKESLGASLLVMDALEKHLTEAIQAVIPARHPGKKYDTSWQDKQNFAMIDATQNMAAEIIYSGGGNALVAFIDQDTAIEVTKEFSWRLLKAAPHLTFAVAHYETDLSRNGNFTEDRKALVEELLPQTKHATLRSLPLAGLSITRQCPQTGFPAMHEGDDGEWISAETHSKRTRNGEKSFFDTLIPEDKRTEYKFPLDIEELGQIRGENHLAVIHIDGNNMGRLLDTILQSQTDYEQAVSAMRQYSCNVSHIYKKTFGELVKIFMNPHADFRRRLEFQHDSQDHKAFLPIRPIVCNGDDVTFVTDGRVGISAAEIFLTILQNNPLVVNGQSYPLSACAGIAIVKTHFPFSHAYTLAEELCASAKKKAKAVDHETPVGSWLDFQIIFSGVTSDLATLRKSQYIVPGMPPIEDKQYPHYHLCWRPWRITHADDDYDWGKFRAVYAELVEKWPRSKLKDLRNTFIKNAIETQALLAESAGRHRQLPEWSGVDQKTGFNQAHQTPYFDALELLDFFLDITKEAL